MLYLNDFQAEKENLSFENNKIVEGGSMTFPAKFVVRKVNNSLTNIRLEDSEYHEKNENWRAIALRFAYDTLKRVLGQMFC